MQDGQEGPTEDAGHFPFLLALLSVKTLFCVSTACGLCWWLSAGLCLEGGVLVLSSPSACCRQGQQGGLLSSMLLQSRDVEGCVMRNLHPLHRQGPPLVLLKLEVRVEPDGLVYFVSRGDGFVSAWTDSRAKVKMGNFPCSQSDTWDL